jgi:predicted Zn-dependent protease
VPNSRFSPRIWTVSVLSALILAPSIGIAQIVKPAEQATAARQHPQILAQFGGEVSGPLANYVTAIGNKSAVAAGLPGQCKFTLVNSDVVNAFAVPGCYIYVTRGLLTITNSEDELALVLGHEIGHIVGKHSYRRQRASTLSSLGALALGALTRSQEVAQQAGQLAQVYALSYSRAQENEADNLGVQYLKSNGYNLYAAPDMLGALGSQEALEAKLNGRQASGVPSWARSHPISAERVARTTAAAAAAGATPTSPPERMAPYFLAINGMRVGDDPDQGFITGRVFAHPKIGVRFEAPVGFSLTNSPEAVVIQGPNNVRGQFAGGAVLQGGLDAYASATLRQLLGQTPAQIGQPLATLINSIPAVSLLARAQSQNGQVIDVAVIAYDLNGKAYHFVMIGPAGQLEPTFAITQSLRTLSASEITNLRPRQIQIVSVRSGDTIASLASRMAYEDFQLDRFMMINGIKSQRALRVGEQLKIISYGAAIS